MQSHANREKLSVTQKLHSLGAKHFCCVYCVSNQHKISKWWSPRQKGINSKRKTLRSHRPRKPMTSGLF